MNPPFLKQYLWEVDYTAIDLQKSAFYVIERILEYGDIEAMQWMMSTYPKTLIIDALKTSRSLSQKSANYWALIFDVPKEEILCLSKQFRALSRAIWHR